MFKLRQDHAFTAIQQTPKLVHGFTAPGCVYCMLGGCWGVDSRWGVKQGCIIHATIAASSFFQGFFPMFNIPFSLLFLAFGFLSSS